MKTDLDALLGQLKDEPPHPGLANLEDAVFRRLAAQTQITGPLQISAGMVAAIGAILLGFVSNGLAPSAEASVSLSPFGPANPLAPSTLLMTER